jgi:hypothetical protein
MGVFAAYRPVCAVWWAVSGFHPVSVEECNEIAWPLGFDLHVPGIEVGGPDGDVLTERGDVKKASASSGCRSDRW